MRIKSGDEVKYLLKETKPSPIDGLQDLLQAVPVWTAQLAVEGAPHIYDYRELSLRILTMRL